MPNGEALMDFFFPNYLVQDKQNMYTLGTMLFKEIQLGGGN